MPQRMKRRTWKNGKYPFWSNRIEWFDDGDDADIRLSLEDSEYSRQLFPTSLEEAEKIWTMFKLRSPKAPSQTPFLLQLLKELGYV